MTWENHFRREMAGVHTWPVFDLRLVVTMARAGYEHIKMSFGVDGDAFGDAMPEAIEDCFTQTKGWRSVLQFVHGGVRCRETSWVTDYAKAPDTSTLPCGSGMCPRDALCPAYVAG